MDKQSIRVLLVDDSPDDVELTRRALAAIREPRFVVESAMTLALAIDRLRDGKYEIVLLDLGLPDSARTETLPRFESIHNALFTCAMSGPAFVARLLH
jgi:DNA-binding response OmpR family regulator